MSGPSCSILKIVPKSWFSWDFSVLESSQFVADIDISWWREKGQISAGGESYEVSREGLMSGAFTLASAGTVLVRAEKPSAFRRLFTIEHETDQYTLCARSAWRREFLLFLGSQEVGSIAPDGIFTRRATVRLPEELPLPVKVFIIWLTVILWKRDSDASGAAG